jgi:(p)ppGpp synthase/HD superfamily hydrolase
MHENRLEKICINLVKENILGTRLSNDTPKYIHSLRVYELLKNERCKFPTQIAGLLHDILEDSNISREELREL